MSTYIETDRIAFEVSSTTSMDFNGDLLLVPFYKPGTKKNDELKEALKASIPATLTSTIKDVVIDLIDRGEFNGDVMTKQVTRIAGPGPIRQLALFGLGPSPKKDSESTSNDVEVTSAARIGKMVSTLARETKSGSIGVAFPFPINNAGITQCVLGVHDVAYVDNRYRKLPEGGHRSFPLKSVTLLGLAPEVSRDVPVTARLTQMIAEGVHLAKDLVGSPPNYKTPVVLADVARKIAADHGLSITVLGQAECEARNMGVST